MPEYDRLRRVWNQQTLPVLLRREQGRLRVRVPYDANDILWIGRTQYWLRGGRHSIPEWFSGKHYWEVPAAWFNDLIRQMLEKFAGVYVIQPFREQEVCAQQCWDARVMNASVRAWVPIMAKANTGNGWKSQIHLQRAGARLK